MTKPKIKLKRGAVRDLLRSPGVEADLARRARQIAQTAGPGMESEADTSNTRARAWVWTDTFDAMRAEATSRDLTQAIDAGRT